jgi:NhaC family Na+:H+ antiporter
MIEETKQHRLSDLTIAFIPIIFLVIALWFNVKEVFGDSALEGSNQVILITAGAIATALAILRGIKFETITNAIANNLSDTTKAILIILLIGGLAGTWMVSGIVPAMIYYGLNVLSAKFFLAACLIICALVSLATGSSWGTTATVGIALIGMGQSMGMNEAMVAGAIISGAYFGDKMSPLSDTTNLAPAMAGSTLFTHIKYMMITTVPSVLIALLLFIILGFTTTTKQLAPDITVVQAALEHHFNITPWLFLVPGLVIFLIARKVDALIAIFIGLLSGAFCILIFQPQVVAQLGTAGKSIGHQSYEVAMSAIFGKVSIQSENPMLADLLTTRGMAGMINTVWLIIAAMIFGGAMQGAGFLDVIVHFIIKLAHSTFQLVASTVGTCIFFNVTASDQYLAIVVPGRMFRELYEKRGLAPENLSRSLEDSGTVTSVLVPWNTCGAYQSGVLGVATGDYFMYAFFNLISPLMTLIVAFFGYKINYLPPEGSLEHLPAEATS